MTGKNLQRIMLTGMLASIALCGAVKADVPENVKVGDLISFGRYEQDNDPENGPEAIDWRVLEVEEDKVFVMSEYGLDYMQFHDEEISTVTEMPWADCSLRKWMNSEFLETAFTEEERAQIPVTTVTTDLYHEDSCKEIPYTDTEDQLYLLTSVDLYHAYDGADYWTCRPTEYVIAKGAQVREESGGCEWWLRNPGFFQADASFGGDEGHSSYIHVNKEFCIRPVMWLTRN